MFYKNIETQLVRETNKQIYQPFLLFFEFHDPITENWTHVVLGDCSKKAFRANGLIGTILTVVAHRLTSLKLENDVINFYGTVIVVAPSVVHDTLRPDALVSVMTPTGTCLIHHFAEEVTESLAHMIPDMQCVWRMTSNCRQTATDE